MQPFIPAVPVRPSDAHIRELAKGLGISVAEVEKHIDDEARRADIHLNDIYQVDRREAPPLRDDWPTMVWLSIKRRDRQPVGDERFRDFQEIKNLLCGPEWEAVELYPAESRLVDTANQYHLWVINGRWPFGFDQRLVQFDSFGGARQKPKG